MRGEPGSVRSAGGVAISRRSVLRGAVAAGLGAGAASLAGCSVPVLSGLTASREEPGTVEYWNLFGGGDGVRMQQMLDGYRQAHPAVTLSATTLAWGNPYYTKLSLATVGDKPPDVAVAHLTRMRTMVAGGLLRELRPDDLQRFGLTRDKFNPKTWDAGLVDGKVYAIPLDTHPFVMFYNTDVCRKAGLMDGDKLRPITGEAAFADAMHKAKAVTGGYGGVVAVINESATPWRIFQSLYAQLGGQVLADGGRRVVLDDAKADRVLALLAGLTRDGTFPRTVDYQGSIAMFANGQAGFLFQGEWEITTFQTAKTPFSMAPFPNVYGGASYACQADSHTLVLPRKPAADAAQLDRSLGFVRSMLDQSKTWAEGGHVPAWLPFRDSDEYKQMTPQSDYAAAADAAVYDPDGWYSGSGSGFEIVTGSAIGSVLSGQLAPGSALRQIHTKLGDLAATAPPI
ncbi:MAG: multiple sugar transport system substrate-binding protein [Mycobacteriales bacterium]|jgi:multiple sugar transport system substrate-binding protein